MKCIVTGHTGGIGKAVYDHFKSKRYDVIGMSRSNGYDIEKDQEKIINESLNCDIFVNCACSGKGQLDLLNKLHDKVKYMIVFGSVSADFSRLSEEYQNKFILQERCRELSINPNENIAKILYLKLAFCENATLPIQINPEYITKFDDIVKIIDLWLEIPKISFIGFVIKITDDLTNYVKKTYSND